jgi:hypothetical protein
MVEHMPVEDSGEVIRYCSCGKKVTDCPKLAEYLSKTSPYTLRTMEDYL